MRATLPVDYFISLAWISNAPLSDLIQVNRNFPLSRLLKVIVASHAKSVIEIPDLMVFTLAISITLSLCNWE